MYCARKSISSSILDGFGTFGGLIMTYADSILGLFGGGNMFSVACCRGLSHVFSKTKKNSGL